MDNTNHFEMAADINTTTNFGVDQGGLPPFEKCPEMFPQPS
jgi:hypothetical protein